MDKLKFIDFIRNENYEKLACVSLNIIMEKNIDIDDHQIHKCCNEFLGNLLLILNGVELKESDEEKIKTTVFSWNKNHKDHKESEFYNYYKQLINEKVMEKKRQLSQKKEENK